MKKRTLLLGFAALTISAASFAGTPDKMQVWLKDGEPKIFDIDQVDSVTFGTYKNPEITLLTENFMPPKFAQPNPLVVNEQEQAFIRANNEFAQKCYQIVRKLPKKQMTDGEAQPRPVHFFSPASLNFALGFCANGATEKGAKEITDALGFRTENALEDMNNFYQKLYCSLNSNVDSVDIHTANALWADNKNNVLENFLETARDKYYATVRHLNFREDPKGSKDTINKWAALMTNDCIKQISADISKRTRLVLNNACYFNAKWKIPFESCGKRLFYGSVGDPEETEFMRIEYAWMKCAKTDNYNAVSLDYSRNHTSDWEDESSTAYSMIVVLPKEGLSLDELLPTLQWDSIPLQYQSCEIRMPKIKVKGGYNLNDTTPELNVINSMGIKDIYESFPNAIELYPGDNPYAVSNVIQDYFLRVDELGTEAAAVTTVEVVETTGMPPAPYVDMFCNRPFAFAIRENATGLILFMGEYDFVPQEEGN